MRPSLRPPAGFSYIALLIALVLISIASTAPVQLGALLDRRSAEEELLAIGNEFRIALISYANASPPGQNRLPRSLADLIKDPRYPNTIRHLRKLYIDPLTGTEEWGLITSVDGRGIVGVHSLSDKKPIKISNFEPIYQAFSMANTYRDWRFLGTGANNPGNTGQTKPNNTNQVPPNQIPPPGEPPLQTK
jgi:type II secretory pathway pseudopilin PulG